jgi:hypothetical protein
MTAYTLALVWSPNLVRHDGLVIGTLMLRNTQVVEYMTHIIEHFTDIFPVRFLCLVFLSYYCDSCSPIASVLMQ